MEVSESRFKELLKAERKLSALEAYGVDNWSGYDDALTEIRKEDNQDEAIEDIMDKIIEEQVNLFEVDYPAGHDAGFRISLIDKELLYKIISNGIQDYNCV